MKRLLQLTTVLSWINIIIGSILVLGGLLLTMVSPDAQTILVSVVLTGSIVLHSYATFQLRKSIIHPEIPLGKQTPIGIRFVGTLALLFGVINITNAIVIIQHTEDVIKQIKFPFPAKNINLKSVVRAAGIFSILFSLSVVMNVLLSFSLLRMYLAKKKSENN
jgi:hypothetical protein